MSEESSGSSHLSGTRYNAPSTRVTIAFPFSTIKVREPDERVVELAEVVVALAERVSEVAPSAESTDLLERARAAAASFKF
jgi:hypothetical protein